MKSSFKSKKQIFFIPAVLALLTAFGLVAGLVGDGAYDLISWLALLAPVLVVAWAWLLYRPKNVH
ncbi:hypothetical protein RE432_03915 [Pusillimonas sp. SM2304]|uniref:hypothetical protein n=1 Tax=Pusillimonas sp. SM2304 TaxID=3073241 RepID=UPI0028756A54|nr:hypothetical protein [Pusillimonas sp. SM2304]MDS1139571.1 hypothetical protein [Pusillimonas sp. SM2304]